MYRALKLFLVMMLIAVSPYSSAVESRLSNQAPMHVQFLNSQDVDLLSYVLKLEKKFIDAIGSDYQKKLRKVKSILIVEDRETFWTHFSSRSSLNDVDRPVYDRVYDDLCGDTSLYTGAVYTYDHIVLCLTGKVNFNESSVWKNKSVTQELLTEIKQNFFHEYTHHFQYILLNTPAISDKMERIDSWGHEWLVEGVAIYFANKYLMLFGNYSPDLLHSYYIDTFIDRSFSEINPTSFESITILEPERNNLFYEFSKYATFSLLQIEGNADTQFIDYFECVVKKTTGCFKKVFHINSEIFYENWTDIFR